MKQLILTLTPTTSAIFSKSAATYGAHQTHDAPTGAALLGWMAGRVYEALNKEEAYMAFHSDKVRFSSAYPVLQTQRAAHVGWPTPRLLLHAKGEKPKRSTGTLIDKNSFWIGPEDFVANNAESQAVQVRGGYLTDSGIWITPSVSGKLRTAMENGRRKEGSLYGYAHVPSSGLTYQSLIDIDTGDAAMDEKLHCAFQIALNMKGNRMFLGRSAGKEYGGGYRVGVSSDGDFFPPEQAVAPSPHPETASSQVRVWCLSDVCLTDEFGSPRLTLHADDLDLQAATLDLKESAVSTRRFSPWNRHLNCRLSERVVIEAGSCFTFKLAANTQIPSRGLRIGTYQAMGLGRIWVAPAILTKFPVPINHAGEIVKDDARPTPRTALAEWAAGLVDDSLKKGMVIVSDRTQNPEISSKAPSVPQAVASLKKLYQETKPRGPNINNWITVARRIGAKKNNTRLGELLFEGEEPVCSKVNSNNKRKWLASNKNKISHRSLLKEIVDGTDHLEPEAQSAFLIKVAEAMATWMGEQA